MRQSILHRLLSLMLSIVLVLGLMLIWIPQDSSAEEHTGKDSQISAQESDNAEEEIAIDDNDTPREISAKVYRFSNRFLGLKNHDITVTIYGTFPVGTKVKVMPEDVDRVADLQNTQGLYFAFEDGEGNTFIPEQSIEVSISFDDGKLDNIEETTVWSVTEEKEVSELNPKFDQDTFTVDVNSLYILAYGTREEDTEDKRSQKDEKTAEEVLPEQGSAEVTEARDEEVVTEEAEAVAVEETGKSQEAENKDADREKKQKLVSQVIKAQTFKEQGSIVQDGTVLIALSGLLPEDATVTAIPVDIAIEGQLVLAAYDITIIDKSGNEFEPDDNSIAVSITTRDIQTAIAEDKRISIFHMENMASEPEEIGSVRVKTKTVQFDAEAFSIYVVSTPHNTETYEFYVGNELYYKEILSNGETLIEPPTPKSSDGGTFRYWVLGENRFNGFVPVEVTETKTYRLDAVFDNAIHVTYFDNSEPEKVIKTEVYQSGEEVDLNGTTIPLNTTQKLIGWNTSKNAENALESLVAGNEDVKLYPVIRSGCWIEFDTDGGEYVEPQFIQAGENATRPDNPKKPGYDFVGWEDENGNIYDFSEQITQNKTLKARWSPRTDTSYTIIYWGEKLEDEGYEILKSESGVSTSGTVLTFNDFSAKKYDYYHLDHMNPDNVIVNGDGSTVINLFFNRNTYTFVFDINSESSLTEFTLNKDKNYPNHGTWSSSWSGFSYTPPEKYTITAKYGEYLGDRWPIAQDFSNYQTDFFGWTTNKTNTFINIGSADNLVPSRKYYVTEDLLQENKDVNGATINYYAYWEGFGRDSRSAVVVSYKQKENGDRTVFDENNYEQYSEEIVNAVGSWFLTNLTQNNVVVEPPEPGYELVHSDEAEGSYSFGLLHGLTLSYKYTYYFAKAEYVITTIDSSGRTIVDSEKKYYNTPIGELLIDHGEAPEPGYIFDGWYSTEGRKFDGTTMPAENLILYAKWTPPSYLVTFDSKGGETIGDQVVEKGNLAEEPPEPSREGYVFGGWIDSENGAPFNFGTKIEHSYNLEALWISDTSYAVSYDLGNGTGTAPTDSNRYIEGAGVTVKDPGNIIPPENSNGFLGWRITAPEENDRIYYPGDVFEMPANDITLTAVYAGKRTAIIKYDSNGGSGETTEIVINDFFDAEPKIPNSDYKVLSSESLGFTRAGFKFIGWSNAPTDKNNLIQPEDIIQVDTINRDSNILYAQWEAANALKVTKQVEGDYGDNTKEFEIRITLQDSSGQLLTGQREFSAYGKYSSVIFEDGIASVLLKHGEYVEIEGLEDWNVSVEEITNGNHLVSYVDENDQSISFPLPLSGNTVVNVINTRDDIPATSAGTGAAMPSVLIILVVLSMLAAVRVYKKYKS